MLIYLDTNIVIYAVEPLAEYRPRALAVLEQLAGQDHFFAISHLVRMECQVGPLIKKMPSCCVTSTRSSSVW